MKTSCLAMVLAVLTLVHAGASYAVSVGEALPELPRVAMLQRGKLKLRGHVVVLDFWASWCAKCRQSLKYLETIESEYNARGVSVITVSLDEDIGEAIQFLKDQEADLTVLHDPSGISVSRFRVAAMPTTLVVDREGKVAAAIDGFSERHRRKLRKTLDSLTTRR